MQAAEQDGTLPARQLAAEVRDATSVVIAEVEAMSQELLESAPREAAAETFLWVRVARLALAADQAVDAGRRGDGAALRAELRHFDSLVSAIWTVHNAMPVHETVLELAVAD
jgi:hypothetical protein